MAQFTFTPVSNGECGLNHDWFRSDNPNGPCWHRIENCDRRARYEAPGRHYFWINMGAYREPIRAIIDDFGNLVPVTPS